MPLAFRGSNPAATIGSQFLDPIIREARQNGDAEFRGGSVSRRVHRSFCTDFKSRAVQRIEAGERLGAGPPSGHLTEAALRMAGGIGRMSRPDWRRGSS